MTAGNRVTLSEGLDANKVIMPCYLSQICHERTFHGAGHVADSGVSPLQPQFGVAAVPASMLSQHVRVHLTQNIHAYYTGHPVLYLFHNQLSLLDDLMLHTTPQQVLPKNLD